MTGDAPPRTEAADASRTGTGPSASVASPSVAGVVVTDASALLGGVVWVLVTVVAGLGPVERALALAPLVLVPLGVGAASSPGFEGAARRPLRAAVYLQPIGAVLLVASLVGPTGWRAAALAAPWVVVTALLGVAALARTLERGPLPLAETLVDAGLAYTVVAAVALVLYHLGLTFWFAPVIVLLTAVHFHYAGFVLPVTTGLVGRCDSAASSRVYRVLAGVVLVGPAVIAVGISFSPTVELVGVGAFTAAVAALAGYVVAVVAPSRHRVQGVVLAASALTLPASMLLALGFVVGTVSGVDPLGLTIPRMVRLHGTLNAFGFALPALVGWRLDVPTALE